MKLEDHDIIGGVLAWLLFCLALAIVAGLVRIADAQSLPVVKVSLITVGGANSYSKDDYRFLFNEARSVWGNIVFFDLARHVHYRSHSAMAQRNTLKDRQWQFNRWRRYFAGRRQYRNTLHVVLMPPLVDGGNRYIAGLAAPRCGYKASNNAAVAWVQSKNQFGEDRWTHSIFATAHEIGHVLGAGHSVELDIMDGDAMAAVVPGYLPWVSSWTKDQVLSCLEK